MARSTSFCEGLVKDTP